MFWNVEVMLKIYSDESEDGHVTTLAGWMASPTGWRHFRRRWRDMLKQFGASEFHTADLIAARRNPATEYSSWEQTKRDDFLDAAVTVLEKNGGAMFSVSCSIATNAAINRNYWVWKQAFGTVGGLSYGMFPSARQAEFVFDEKEKVRGHVEKAYRAARAEHANFKRFAHSRKPTFQTSLRTLPLQAADLLAWGLRRSVSDRIQGRPAPLPWIERLKNGCQTYKWKCVDYDGWRLIKQAVDSGMEFHHAWSALIMHPDTREY